MNHIPRVLFINPWDKRIGPNRYLYDFLCYEPALAERAIIVLKEDGAAAQEYRALGCAVEIWQDAALVHVQTTPANLWRQFKRHTIGLARVVRRLRALQPAVVFTNSENVWVGGMAARLLHIPHAQAFHALTLEHHWGSREKLPRRYLRWLGLWNTNFVAVSQAVAQMLTRYGASPLRITFLPNSLDLAAIELAARQPLPAEIQARIQNRFPVIVSFGRIAEMKGHDVIIEALASVRAAFPNLICLFAGQVGSAEGVEDTQSFYQNLQQQIQILGLSDAILFLGEIDYGAALLRASDVYVQASRTESFCRAVAEALLAETPVIASAVGGIPEVMGEGGGTLIPVSDAAALAAALCQVLNDLTHAKERARVGRQHVIANYDASQMSVYLRAFLLRVAASS